MTDRVQLSTIMIFFWGLWFLIVSLTDTVDLLQNMGFIANTIPYTSKNFAFLTKFTSIYDLSPALNWVIFSGIFVWTWFTTVLFGLWLFKGRELRAGIRAMVVGIAMTLFFILADEIFINYETEHGHLLRLIAQLLSLQLIAFKNIKE